ncbi:hypothetical protein V2J09_015912 [Rumex salicifolius]
MGTREVYEEKLRTGDLHHDPTLNPGLGTARCPRCLSPLDSRSADGDWTITPVLHDATAVAGSGLGALLSTNMGLIPGWHTLKNMLKDQSGVSFWLGKPLKERCAVFTFGKIMRIKSIIGIINVNMMSSLVTIEFPQVINDHYVSIKYSKIPSHVMLGLTFRAYPILPALMLFTAGSAAFGGYALPRFTQLTVTSFFAFSSASHYGISLLTRHLLNIQD